MMNAVTINETMFVETSVDMLKAMAEDKAIQAASTIDEAYEAFKKYSNVTKEEFIRMTGLGTRITEEATQGEMVELTEDELDMVVGGSIFTKAWSGIKTAARKVAETASDVWDATPDWAKGAVVGAVIIGGACTGFSAVVAGYAAVTGLTGFGTAMSAVTSGLVVATAVGGVVGGVVEGAC